MSLDRTRHRKNTAKSDYTPHADTVVAQPQQAAPDLAISGHNFSDISLLAPEAQPATEEAAAIDSEQSHEIVEKQGKGAPLTPAIREPMEAAFGYNFAQVRIHADTGADSLSRRLDARAFTLGSDIFLS